MGIGTTHALIMIEMGRHFTTGGPHARVDVHFGLLGTRKIAPGIIKPDAGVLQQPLNLPRRLPLLMQIIQLIFELLDLLLLSFHLQFGQRCLLVRALAQSLHDIGMIIHRRCRLWYRTRKRLHRTFSEGLRLSLD